MPWVISKYAFGQEVAKVGSAQIDLEATQKRGKGGPLVGVDIILSMCQDKKHIPKKMINNKQ